MKSSPLRVAVLTILLTGPVMALSSSEREKLVKALIMVESGGRPNPKPGDQGRALGPLQIHAVMVADINRMGHTSYRWEDMTDRQKAIRAASEGLALYDEAILRATGRTATARELAFIWNGGSSAWRRGDKPLNDTKQKNLERYWDKVSKHYSA